MSITAQIDQRRIVNLSDTTGEVTVTFSGVRLTFTTGLNVSTFVDCPLGFAGIDVPIGAILRVSATLANGKTFTGPGTVTVTADTSNLSALILDADRIQLTAGADYTLGFQQAKIASTGTSGDLGTLTSSGAITIKDIPSGSNLSTIKTDANDSIILNPGASYILTVDQAKIAKVGSAGPAGNFTGAGVITIQASDGTDLSSFTTRSTDIFILSAGQDYSLTLAQAAIAKVGNGSIGDLKDAGNVTVKCPTADDLSLTPVQGIDILQLTTGVNYTLNASQAATAKIGAAGAMGNLLSAGVITIKANTPDIFKVVTDSNDIIILNKGSAYTLTTDQLSRTKVTTTGTMGNLFEAGTIEVKANPAGEDLSLSTATGIDLIQLSAGKDYVLTTAQAVISGVESFNLGNFGDAGNITLKASLGEDLSALARTLTGIDVIQLAAGKNYSLTVSQAKIARVDGTGTIGNLTAAGAITVYADTPGTGDLSALVLGSSDSLVLAQGGSYTLTALQASIATVGSPLKGATPPVGNLSKTSSIKIKASPLGEDISGLTAVGVKSIEISPGQKYTLTSAQAAISEFPEASGQSPKPPTLTIKAQAGEDLTSTLGAHTSRSFTKEYDAIHLTAGQSYTLTAEQALKTKVGLTGEAGNLSTAGAITLIANIATDISKITMPATASIVLSQGLAYTLTGAQALISKVGVDGTMGNLATAGALTILAGTQSDLSSIQTGSDDTIVLNSSLNYILTSAEALRSKVGATGPFGDLKKAGVVTVKAFAGEDLSLSELVDVPGIDYIQLTTGADYKLTPAQLLISKFSAGAAGQVASAGVLTVVAKTSADLSLLNTDSTDLIHLSANQNYTLTSTQAQVASIPLNLDGTKNVGNLGSLNTGGTITVKASTASTGEDLSKLTVQGVDFYQLTAGVPYTLTAAQASIAKLGAAGALGKLVSTAAITINTAANTEKTDLSTLQTDSSDIILLSTVPEYQLTAGQAAISKIVSAGVTGAAGNLIGLSKVTIDARAGGADLSKILVDSGDSFWLAPGQKYTMTTAQAATAKVVGGLAGSVPGLVSSLGDLSKSGAIKLIASPTGNEVLTNLVTDALDVIQLTDKQAYTLTAAQAKIAQVGTGAFGNLVSTGTITVVASGDSDLSSVLLDKGDQIILAAGVAYTLNPLQAGIAKVGTDSTSTVGDLSGASVSVKAAANTTVAAPEDLTALASSNAVGYKLSVGQNYILTSTQAQISSVASLGITDLTKAGVITIKAAVDGEKLSATLATVRGVDAIQLTASADYTLTAAQLALAKILTVAGTSPTGTSGTTSTGTSGTSSTSSATVTGVVTVLAKTGEDLSTLTNTDSNDIIYLSEDQNYTLTTAQAKIASVVAWDQTGNPVASDSKTLAGSGNVIIKASSAATGEDLSELNIPGINTYVLTAGSPYTLTAGQAAISKMGLGGSLGNLASSGVLTISATASGTNLSSIQTDANDIIQLYDGRDFTLTAAQAATAKIGTTGTLGALKSDGNITIDATAAGIDLSKLALDSGDLIVLAPGQKYTMTTAQAAIAKVTPGGAAGDLRAAGAIKLIANPLGDDSLSTSLIKENPLDIIQLTDKMAYTLSASQALIAQVGNGVVGNLVSTGAITVVAGPVESPATTMTDLSSLLLDRGDSIILTSGQKYTLSSLEASIAKVTTLGNAGVLSGVNATLKASKVGEDLSGLANSGIVNYVLSVGQNYTLAPTQLSKTTVYINAARLDDLTKAGFVTVKADPIQDDLSTIEPSNLSGVDAIQLTSGGNYTLTPKEALIAKVGATGRLASLAQPGVVTIDARAEPKVDLSGIGTDALDVIWLQSGNDYTLTTAQAPRVKIYAGGVGNSILNVPISSTLGVIDLPTKLTIKASASTTVSAPEDLTVLPNGFDEIKLVSGQNYVMTSEQALIATVGATPNPNALHDLSKAGVVTIKSTNPVGEDLSWLIGQVKGVDQIQLMTGLNYQLDFSQALTAKVGASGAIGNLTSTGKITVKATKSADMTKLVLDEMDSIVLTPGHTYTLNATQVAIAQMVGTPISLVHESSTQIFLKANPMGEDLSVLKASAIPNIDSIILTSGQNYNLTSAEALIAQVGLVGAVKADLSKAGKITLTEPSMPSGSLLLPAKGIDIIKQVMSDSSFELFASSKLSPTHYSDFSVPIDPIASDTAGGTAGSNSVVDKAGEWKFDSVSHVLTVWDGKTVQSITLAGVDTVSVASFGSPFTYSLIVDAPYSIAGGAGNDAITGGSGDDTFVGGAGNDSITAGKGNDSITGGEGVDRIISGGGMDTIVLTESTSVIDTIVFAETGPANVDAVIGFVVAMDLVEVTIGAFTGSVSTISSVAGTDIGAALAGGAFNTITVAESVATDGGTNNALFLSSTARSTFATAIGSGSVTGATDANFATATEGVLTVWYDATKAQAVVGVWVNNSTTVANTLTSEDTFVEIVRVGMTSTNYTLANIDAMLSAA